MGGKGGGKEGGGREGVGGGREGAGGGWGPWAWRRSGKYNLEV